MAENLCEDGAYITLFPSKLCIILLGLMYIRAAASMKMVLTCYAHVHFVKRCAIQLDDVRMSFHPYSVSLRIIDPSSQISSSM